jgi:Dehydrogenases with different specificities (related to short-chain alcohol dehydrogenases)
MNLKGKNVIITGCQQGIGLATMKAAATAGANVFACCQTQKEDFDSAVAELESKCNVRIIPVYFDFSDEASIKNAVKQIQSEKMPIHGLANIAGMTGDSLFPMIRQDKMEMVFKINFFSQIYFTQYVVRLMQRTGGGSIVNVSSISAIDGNPGQVVYSATKASWIATTKTLSKELGPNHIRVNAVAPGVIESLMTKTLIDEGKMDNKIKKISMNRAGKTSEVANAIVYLLSDDSSYVTGQILRIDGGIA